MKRYVMESYDRIDAAEVGGKDGGGKDGGRAEDIEWVKAEDVIELLRELRHGEDGLPKGPRYAVEAALKELGAE